MINVSGPKFADMKQASVQERVRFIKDGAIFETPTRRKIRDLLDTMVTDRRSCSDRLLFLTAPSGMGLSCLIKEFEESHPPSIEFRSFKPSVPVINEPMFPNGEIVDFCDELRERLAIPGHILRPRQTSLRETVRLLQAVGTRVLIFEDFHRISDFRRPNAESYKSFVHYLISKYDISVVLTGTPQIWRWAQSDEQTMSRSLKVEYKAWGAHDTDFAEFLDAFEAWCPTQKGAYLANDTKFRKSLIRRTHGILRYVAQELTSLAVFAIYSGSERLDFETWLALNDREV